MDCLVVLGILCVSSSLAFRPVTRRDASRQLGQWRIEQTELDTRSPLADDLQHFSDWFWEADDEEVVFFSSANALVGGRMNNYVFEVEVIAEAPGACDTFSTRARVNELLHKVSGVCVGRRMRIWQRRRYLSLLVL